MASKKKNLIFASVGDAHNVESWLDVPEKREFDVAVCYFGDDASPDLATEYFVRRKGLKFSNFYHFLSLGIIDDYDAVWVVDDDIIMDTVSVNVMFRIFAKFNLLLAQPSFNPDCKRPWRHTYQQPGFLLRFTNFVENGVALFSTEVLDILSPSFRDAGTGFGVDFIWPSLLGFPRNRIAVIDAVSCMHPDDHPSTLNEIIPRPKHKALGTELLIKYGLLPADTEVSEKRFVHPFVVEEYGAVKR